MGDVVRGNAVVVEQIPLTLELHDAVVGSPTHDGVEQHTLIGEGTVRIISNGLAEEVAVARRVREVVLTVVLMHP